MVWNALQRLQELAPILNRRRWFLAQVVAASGFAWRPPTAHGTPQGLSPPPVSREMEVLIDCLRRGARLEQEPIGTEPSYVVWLVPDITDRRIPPQGSDYYMSTVDSNVGLLRYGELERVWYVLFGFVEGVANCPIGVDWACCDFGIWFSRRVRPTVLASCADRVISMLVDHEAQCQHLAASLRSREV